MLRLAVATASETFDRMRAPLAERDIQVGHVDTYGRTLPLCADAAEPFGAYDVGFVFPPRRTEGGVADTFLDVPWVNGRTAVNRSRNKAEVLARLDRAGLPVPDSVLVSNPIEEAELRAVYERFEPPVVVKPTSATRGVGVGRAPDLDTFMGLADYCSLVHDFNATGDKSFLVQSFVPDARDVRVMVVDGEYAGAVERRRADDAGWANNVHRGAEATGIDLDDEHRRLAERVADVLEIPYLGVDLLVGPDGAVVSETNARPTIDDVSKYEPGFWDDLAGLIRDTAESE